MFLWSETLYCTTHAEVICSICENTKHRNCVTCLVEDKVTKDTKKISREAIDKAKSPKATMEICKQDIELEVVPSCKNITKHAMHHVGTGSTHVWRDGVGGI